MIDKRVLVTGGVGFIGQHLVKRLVAGGAKVTVVDDLSSSSMTPRLQQFYRRHNVIFHHETLEKWFPPTQVGTFEQIYHLACRVGPAKVLDYAGKMGREIIGDAMKMAELSIRDDAPLFSISTSEVYGTDPNGIPQDESFPIVFSAIPSARQEYTLGKYMTEVSLQLRAQGDSRLRVNLIRPFNIVGPGQGGDGGYVLPRFVAQALSGRPITVFGDGTQIRAFTHVADLVDAVLAISRSEVSGKIYNVGTPENTLTIADLAHYVVDVLNSSSEIHLVDPQKIYGSRYANAPSKIPSIKLIMSEVGWTPRIGLREIIEDIAREANSLSTYARETAEAVA